jgi:mono/diheme cytochrome c family protein
MEVPARDCESGVDRAVEAGVIARPWAEAIHAGFRGFGIASLRSQRRGAQSTRGRRLALAAAMTKEAVMMRFITILGLTAVLSAAAYAQDGDVRAGRAYAEAVCARCHDIEDGLLSPNPKSPPFGTIAHTPGITGAALNTILRTPHRDMPDLILPKQDLENVIAYILSLKR